MRTIYLELSRDFSLISLSLIPWVLEDLRARSLVSVISFLAASPLLQGAFGRQSETPGISVCRTREETSGTQGISLFVSSLISRKTLFELGLDLTVKII